MFWGSPSFLTRPALVLPHEKLYLDHLPSADRYYKSFMHRDVINFSVITKFVLFILVLWEPVNSPVTHTYQDRLLDHYFYRRSPEVLEEARAGH